MARDGAAVVRRRQLTIPSRKAWLVVAFVVVFLTFGVPRWLAGDQQGTSSPTAAQFTELCRQHGGTPHASPGAAGGPASAQQFCTIRYGATVYRMDAITAHGFDEDTAKFQRQGCVQAQSEPGHRGSFVYHAETGVCEHRP